MRRFNLEQLAAFMAVQRARTVRGAAERLHITQPAVTARLARLEEMLGTALFERSARGMTLTAQGERLVHFAEEFERLADGLEEAMIAPDHVERRLRIGASETVAQCWLPDLVAAVHQRYPRVGVDIDVDISLHLRSRLLERRIDLAFLLGPVSDYSVENLALPAFELGWFAAAQSDGETLAGQPIVTYARSTRPYRELKAALAKRVGPDVSLFPSSSLSACFRLVEAGLGIGALPVRLAGEHLARGTIRRLHFGWQPDDLRFTASWLGEPRDHVLADVAALALTIATHWQGDKSD